MKFKKGDRIQCVNPKYISNKYTLNEFGTIYYVSENSYGIIFDKNIRGHNLGGVCKTGYGWWVVPEVLRLANINKRIE